MIPQMILPRPWFLLTLSSGFFIFLTPRNYMPGKNKRNLQKAVYI